MRNGKPLFKNGDLVVVVAPEYAITMNKHPDFKIMLYVIERKDGYGHPLYIISEDGLTKAW